MEAQSDQIKKLVGDYFNSKFVPAVQEFIRIPNLSPNFDNEFLTNGLT